MTLFIAFLFPAALPHAFYCCDVLDCVSHQSVDKVRNWMWKQEPCGRQDLSKT